MRRPWFILALSSLLAGVGGGVLLIEPTPAQGPKPASKQKLLTGKAVEFKFPLGKIPHKKHAEAGEDFLAMRQHYFVRPRAYPNTKIDHRHRVKARESLRKMRVALKRPHVKALWWNRPRKESPITTETCPWVSIGPTNINGRVTNIAIDPSTPQRIFVSTVGGVWRSTDSARRWQRVSDDFLATVCASMAINPSNGKEVFVGTGDPNYATHGHNPGGTGIWRSTSSGDPGTWTKVTPPELDNQTIFRIRIDPAAPNNLYAATSAGVYLGTRSGTGITWGRLKDFNAWTSDLVVDFSATPRLVYAGVAWPSATAGNGIWKFDGSAWQKRDTGIPTGQGRTVALALAASNPKVLYSKFENASSGALLGVYKTTTAGEKPAKGNAWSNLAGASVMDDSYFSDGKTGYSWYNSILEVDPKDANTVYGGGLNIYRTTNGGTNWNAVSSGADPNYLLSVHSDHHAVAFDPKNSKVVYVGNDGGIYRSTDTTASTWHWNDVSHGMIITQFYRITTQQMQASLVAGGSQDNGTEVTFGNRTWYNPYGCDGADVAIDAVDSVTLYLNCNGGLHELANPVPGTPGGGSEISWTVPTNLSVSSPLVTDPGKAGAALAAGSPSKPLTQQRLLKTTNGVKWTAASPNLPAGTAISFIAIGPSSKFQTYYIGVDGATESIWSTFNGGTKWNTTPKGLPAGLRPNAAAVDNKDPKRAVAGFGGAAGGAVYLTTDGGSNWKSLGGSGSSAFPSLAQVTGVVFSPFNANVVYVATIVGVFRGTITPGATPSASWMPFDEGLPAGIDVTDISVNRASGRLTIGTFGYGAYQRNIRPGMKCSPVRLVVRDNVFDRGRTPSAPAAGLPDPEHPVPDSARPGFYKPGPPVHWWSSPDIRIDVPSLDKPANRLSAVDHVEFETAPLGIAPAPPGTMQDHNPVRGRLARVYVQVSNRGLQPGTNVRVLPLWTDATAGLPLLPADFWSKTFPAGSTTCGPLASGSKWHFVDPKNPCKVIPVVNPALPEVVGFDWEVPKSAAEHTCMMAIIDCPSDPLEPSIRKSNERRPWVFVPNSRHIAQRNLHIVTVAAPKKAQKGLLILNFPNPHKGKNPVALHVSRDTMRPGSTLGLLLPKGKAKPKGTTQPAGLHDTHVAQAKKHDLDHERMHVVHDKPEHVVHLAVPAGETWKVGIVYQRSPQAAAGTASRFTIVARDGNTVVGGSTFILRTPGQ
jgi:photosystem II stability/assembly factor-like uncharacterized protein